MIKAVGSYSQKPRSEWVLDWPGQVIIASSAIHWTSEVEYVSKCYTNRCKSVSEEWAVCGSVAKALYHQTHDRGFDPR